VADAKLGKQCINRLDLNPGSAAHVAKACCLDMVPPIRDEHRQRGKPSQNFITCTRSGKALQQFLQYQPGRNEFLAGFNGPLQLADLRRR